MEAPVVLTRVLLAHRRYFAEFFLHGTRFAEIQSQSRPVGNGEDIILSYVARHSSDRLNRVHAIPIHELPAPHAMHGRNWAAHVAHRTRLMRACEAWLAEARPTVRYCDERQADGTTNSWEELHAS